MDMRTAYIWTLFGFAIILVLFNAIILRIERIPKESEAMKNEIMEYALYLRACALAMGAPYSIEACIEISRKQYNHSGRN